MTKLSSSRNKVSEKATKPKATPRKRVKVIDASDMSPEEIAKATRRETVKRTTKQKPVIPEAEQAEARQEAAAKPKLGRPSKYTPELAREICIRMAGGETLRQVCRDDHMPAASTVRGWVVDNVDGFSEHYTRARTLLAEHWADEILEIADGSVERTMEGRLDGADVQQKRLQVDSRKWLLSKALPKVYGDKLDLNHGVQPDNPLASLIQRVAGTGLPVVPENEDSQPD